MRAHRWDKTTRRARTSPRRKSLDALWKRQQLEEAVAVQGESPDGLRWTVRPWAFGFGERDVWEPAPPFDALPYALFDGGIRAMATSAPPSKSTRRTSMLRASSDCTPCASKRRGGNSRKRSPADCAAFSRNERLLPPPHALKLQLTHREGVPSRRANGGAPVSTGASFVPCGVHECRRARQFVGTETRTITRTRSRPKQPRTPSEGRARRSSPEGATDSAGQTRCRGGGDETSAE